MPSLNTKIETLRLLEVAVRMPEGPECHRTAINLNARRAGSCFVDVIIESGRYKTHGPFQGYELLIAGIRKTNGLRVIAVAAWGKLIIWMLSRSLFIHCTLGLKGGWSRSKRKHGGVCFVFDNGREWFNDQLHYGTIKVCGKEETVKKLLALGPDVCRPETGFTLQHFRGLLKRRATWDISKLLMDQKSMAGLGNYLKSDVLYACGVHPSARCGDISLEKQAELWHVIKELSVGHLNAYINGTRMGKLVYGRRRDKRGNKVCKVKTGDKRNTHYVPVVQKLFAP